MDELSYLRPPGALAGILEATAALGFTMASEPRTGALLRTLAAAKPGGRLLELGTGTGVGTAWLLDGMDAAAELVSVDVDPAGQAAARRALGGDARLRLVCQDGAAFLERQAEASFDMIFADAIAGKYEALEAALRTVKAGGFYVIDDMLPQPNWPAGHAPRVDALLVRLAALPDFAMAPMAWASGMAIAVRI